MLGACAVCRLHNNKYTAGAVLTRACLWVALLHFSSISFTLITTMLSHIIIPHTFPSTNVTWLAASWPIREGQPLAIDGAMTFKTWPNIRGISFTIDTSELWWGIGTGSTACLSSIGTGHTAGSPLWPQSPVTVNCRGVKERVNCESVSAWSCRLHALHQIYAVCVRYILTRTVMSVTLEWLGCCSLATSSSVFLHQLLSATKLLTASALTTAITPLSPWHPHTVNWWQNKQFWQWDLFFWQNTL